MENIIGYAVNIFFTAVGAVIFVGIAVSVLRRFVGAEVTVAARVADKQIVRGVHYSKIAAPTETEKHIVSFETENGILRFEVSRATYDNCVLNHHGVLKYKGNKLIDFD